MTNPPEDNVAKIIANLYQYHDTANNSWAGRYYPITPTGLSVLDDVEAHLTKLGPIGEEYFLSALEALARELIGRSKRAND